MRFLKMNLRNFIETVYKYDVEKLYEFDTHIDTSWVRVEDHEIEEVREQYKIGDDVSDDQIREAIDRAKSWTYERTYTDEYSKGVYDTIEEKLKKDFDNLQDFFSASNEITVEGKLTIKKIDWANDEITFEGKISKLETYILNAVNGYGIFHYESLDEFRYAYGGYDIKKRIESHLHWLKYMEDIYGTIYNFFKLDLSYVDYYGTLGNTDYDEEDIICALSDEGIKVA